MRKEEFKSKLFLSRGRAYKLVEETYKNIYEEATFEFTGYKYKSEVETFKIVPYFLIESCSNQNTIKNLKRNLTYVKTVLNRKFGVSNISLKKIKLDNFYHIFFVFNYDGKTFKILYIDESYCKNFNLEYKNKKFIKYKNYISFKDIEEKIVIKKLRRILEG